MCLAIAIGYFVNMSFLTFNTVISTDHTCVCPIFALVFFVYLLHHSKIPEDTAKGLV